MSPAVYVQTNDATGNEVIAFDAAAEQRRCRSGPGLVHHQRQGADRDRARHGHHQQLPDRRAWLRAGPGLSGDWIKPRHGRSFVRRDRRGFPARVATDTDTAQQPSERETSGERPMNELRRSTELPAARKPPAIVCAGPGWTFPGPAHPRLTPHFGSAPGTGQISPLPMLPTPGLRCILHGRWQRIVASQARKRSRSWVWPRRQSTRRRQPSVRLRKMPARLSTRARKSRMPRSTDHARMLKRS